MNLALQKRNEQLERWRQNEANAELIQQKQQQTQASNSPYQRFKTSSDCLSPRRNNNSLNESLDIADSVSSPSSNRRGNKQGRSYANLQVKFSNPTLFINACASGDLSECERLLSENLVDIDVTTNEGLTGLHQAAINDNAKMVETLLSHGANINCCDNEGWTPLHAAASLGKEGIIKMLLGYDADATIVNCENLLAYDLARTDQVKELIGAHLQGLDIDQLRSQEERAIQEDIERWIKTGQYDERSHPATNATVLHVLAAKGYVKQMKQLLEHPTLRKQVDLEAKDFEGFTPLLAASFWSQTDIVQLLIEAGANIFAKANDGYKISSIHLKNYQQSKLQHPQPTIRTRSSIQSLDSKESEDNKRSTTSLDSSATEISHDDSEKIPSGSVPRHLKTQGTLLKSKSLDIEQQPPDESPMLVGSMSVDRLLLRSESMTERELRRSYKELVMENEKLRRQLQDEKDNRNQQDWIRKERQMQRKISELEEEIRQLEQWKHESQRLKDENRSLIRVVTKLSKQH